MLLYHHPCVVFCSFYHRQSLCQANALLNISHGLCNIVTCGNSEYHNFEHLSFLWLIPSTVRYVRSAVVLDPAGSRIFWMIGSRARICKRLRSPGTNYEEWIPPGWESIPMILKRFTNTGSGPSINSGSTVFDARCRLFWHKKLQLGFVDIFNWKWYIIIAYQTYAVPPYKESLAATPKMLSFTQSSFYRVVSGIILKIGSRTGIDQSRFTTLTIFIIQQLVYVRVQLLLIHTYTYKYTYVGMMYSRSVLTVYTVEQKRKPYAVVASAVKPKGIECEPDTPCGQRGME